MVRQTSGVRCYEDMAGDVAVACFILFTWLDLEQYLQIQIGTLRKW